MLNLSGIKIERYANGKPKNVIVSVRTKDKIAKAFLEELEDYLDGMEAEKRKVEKRVSFEEVIKELDKKHGIRRKAE